MGIINRSATVSGFLVGTVGAAVAFVAGPAMAQSGSSTQPRYAPVPAVRPAPAASGTTGSATAGSDSAAGSNTVGSGTAAAGASVMARNANLPVALRGFCPVCLMDMRQWVKGKDQFAASYDGKTYLFPEQKQLDAFRKNPVHYVPQLGGDCVVHFAQTGQRVAGDLRLGAVHNNRLVFFSSEQHRKTFHLSPASYTNTDLVLGGECVVCRVDGNMHSPGQQQLTLLHHGMRYQFASVEHLNAFSGAPMNYAKAAEGSAPRAAGSAPAASGTTGSGATGSGSPNPGTGSGTSAPAGSSGGR